MIRAAILLLVAVEAQGAACTKIDYIEARDWSRVKAEAAYCEAGRQREALAHDSGRAIGESTRAANALMRESDACGEQQAMFGRVIENVHKRPLPVCKP